MKKKFPKNWSDEEGEEETLDEGETYLTENDTKEVSLCYRSREQVNSLANF